MKNNGPKPYQFESSDGDGRGVIVLTLASAMTTLFVILLTIVPYLIRVVGDLIRTIIPGRPS